MAQFIVNSHTPRLQHKDREPFITPGIEPELHPYLASIFRALKSPSLAIDGTEDHIHVLFLLVARDHGCDLVEEVKTGIIKMDQNEGPRAQKFSLAGRIRRFLNRSIKC